MKNISKLSGNEARAIAMQVAQVFAVQNGWEEKFLALNQTWCRETSAAAFRFTGSRHLPLCSEAWSSMVRG